MDKVLIVSPSLNEENDLRSVAGQHSTGNFSFETTASFAQPASFWFKTPPKVLILSMPDNLDLQEMYFDKLKADLPVNQRIVFLCPVLSPKLMQVSTLFEKVRLYKAPVTGYFLFRALVDLTTEFSEEHRQIHPRYSTDVPVEVQTQTGEPRKKAQMRNLSIGGAYIEMQEALTPYKAGDLLQISIELSGLRFYNFEAKVVWSKPLGAAHSFGYGMAFIDKEEVYDTLLAGVGRNF